MPRMKTYKGPKDTWRPAHKIDTDDADEKYIKAQKRDLERYYGKGYLTYKEINGKLWAGHMVTAEEAADYAEYDRQRVEIF